MNSPQIKIIRLVAVHHEIWIPANLSINKCEVVRSVVLYENEWKLYDSDVETSAYVDDSSIDGLQINIDIINFTWICYSETR